MRVATAGGIQAHVLTERTALRLTLGFVLLSQIGAHIDGWYHLRYGFAIESFLTWPHAVYYAGRAGVTLVAGVYLWEGWRAGQLRWASIPRGYLLILVGSGLFVAGGAFDWAWHATFGFEVSLATLVSPAHLWLNVSAVVMVLGMVQVAAEWRARDALSGYRLRGVDVPLLLALGVLLRVILWSLFYSEPAAVDYASGGTVTHTLSGYAGITWEGVTAQIVGTTGAVLHSVLVVLYLLTALRRFRLPGGSIAVILLWNGLLTVAVTGMWLYLPAIATGALAGEAVWAAVWRGRLGGLAGDLGYWLLAFTVPFVQFLAYFGLMQAFGGGVIWETHLTMGMPVMAGLYGLLASGFVIPPRLLRPSTIG